MRPGLSSTKSGARLEDTPIHPKPPSGIPERFISGLRDAELLLALSREVASQAAEN